MGIKIDVRADVRRVTKSLGALADKQIPFATAQAINRLGGMVLDAEKASLKKVFPTATPFTLNSIRQTKARKGYPETTIALGDIAEAYLAPYIDGGKHFLNSRALLNPKDIALNQYGNLPRKKLASLKGRSDVFIGDVKTKSGATINGVWQRIPAMVARKATKKRPAREASGARLKLLIRFGDALPVRENLPWGTTAQKIVTDNFDAVFGAELGKAIATARDK